MDRIAPAGDPFHDDPRPRSGLAVTTRLHRSLCYATLSIALDPACALAGASPANAGICMDTAAGQLARWPGDGTPDEVAHGRDGTLVGGTTYAAGEVGQAFSFDGSNDTVTVPDDTNWTLGGDFTIDTWVNFAGFTGHQRLGRARHGVRGKRGSGNPPVQPRRPRPLRRRHRRGGGRARVRRMEPDPFAVVPRRGHALGR